LLQHLLVLGVSLTVYAKPRCSAFIASLSAARLITPPDTSMDKHRDNGVTIVGRDISGLSLLRAFHLVPVPIMPEVAVVIAIPTVVVRNPSMLAVPIAVKKHSTFIPRNDPVGTCVWRPRPVPFMPFVTIAFWIPIAVYPEIVGTGGRRANALHTWRWRWSHSKS
jgi:hypothetical protein